MATVFYVNQPGADAVTALNALWDLASSQFSSFSTTSVLIGTGSKSLTIEAGKALSVGQPIAIYSTASVTNNMQGTVTSYNAATGALVVNVTSINGAGTLASWTVVSPGSSRIGVDIHGSTVKATPADADEIGFLDSAATFILKKLTFRNLVDAVAGAFGATILTGSGVSTEDAKIELGSLRTGVGNAYIDLHATAGSDYDARLMRLSGANGGVVLSNRGTGTIDLQTNDLTQFRISPVANAANFVQVYGAVTGGQPTFEALGTDANIGVNQLTKGSGAHNFWTGGGTAAILQFQIAHTPNAVNYLQTTGGAAGSAVSLAAAGSDANVSVNYQTKGAGAHNFYAAGALQFQITAVAGAVNYLAFNGAISGSAVTLSAQGGDPNINLNLTSKGTGVVQANGVQVMTAGNALSFRNKIRNPKMEIAQRGVSLTGLTGSAPYTLDGWRYDTTGGVTAVVTASQGAGSLVSSEFQNYLKVQVTTAQATVPAGQLAVVQQVIEGFLVRDLIGNPIAIQFEVSSPKAGQHYVCLRNGTDRSCLLPYTATAANTPQKVYLTLPAGLITAGTWNWTNGMGLTLTFPLITGSTWQTATTGAWVTGNFHSGTGQQNLLDTVGNVFSVTGVQLEKNNASTAFEHRDISTEVVLNLRYYEIVHVSFAGVAAAAGHQWGSAVNYKVNKRAIPVISNIATNIGVNVTSSTSDSIDLVGFRYYVTAGAAGSFAADGTSAINAEL